MVRTEQDLDLLRAEQVQPPAAQPGLGRYALRSEHRVSADQEEGASLRDVWANIEEI